MTKKIAVQDALAQMERATDKRVLRVGAIEYSPTVEQPKDGDEEVMCVLVSDLQLGHKTPTTNTRIIRNRAGRLIQAVVRIASLHRHMYPVRKLYVFMLGDMVHNLPPFFMNFAEMETALYEQVYDHAVPILAGMLKSWAQEFEEVHVVCVPGNHAKQGGKMGDNNFNLDTIIYLTLRQMYADNDRLVWHGDCKNWWHKETIFHTTFLAVHGHQVKMWMNLPWYGLTTRSMRWQGSVPGKRFQVMLTGHFHVTSSVDWNDTEIIVNGCFVSDDDWVLETLGMSSSTKQMCFGVHPRKGITFRYNLDLD